MVTGVVEIAVIDDVEESVVDIDKGAEEVVESVVDVEDDVVDTVAAVEDIGSDAVEADEEVVKVVRVLVKIVCKVDVDPLVVDMCYFEACGGARRRRAITTSVADEEGSRNMSNKVSHASSRGR